MHKQSVPQWEMVVTLIKSAPPSSKKLPEKISWKISRKGMTVMAAVVVLTIQETISAMVSAAKVTSSRVIPISTIPQDVMMPDLGK